MNTRLKLAYSHGCFTALLKLGMEDMPLPEEMPMPLPEDTEGGGEARTSDDFVALVQEDDTDEMAAPNAEDIVPPGMLPEKKPSWSGRASLDGGDVGTRSLEMGLPAPGAV